MRRRFNLIFFAASYILTIGSLSLTFSFEPHFCLPATNLSFFLNFHPWLSPSLKATVILNILIHTNKCIADLLSTPCFSSQIGFLNIKANSEKITIFLFLKNKLNKKCIKSCLLMGCKNTSKSRLTRPSIWSTRTSAIMIPKWLRLYMLAVCKNSGS